VVKVHAADEDKGVNGQVKYSIVRQPNQKGVKFTVNEETGEVLTNKVNEAWTESNYTEFHFKNLNYIYFNLGFNE